MTLKFFRIRRDLGIRSLVPEWRQLLRPTHLRDDLVAGVTVACIAIPLSLAIALASGVPPAVGLFTAIVGGIVCALFGGAPLAVSGPAAAMTVLIASIVQSHGIAGLLIVGVLCGALQLLTGLLGVGRAIRFVPVPVVEGFTAGIGAIILIGQIPRVLGVDPPAHSHVWNVLSLVPTLVRQANPVSIGIAVSTVALVFGLPKLHARVPAALLAILMPTVLLGVLGVSTVTIGTIPSSLPWPKLPSWPTGMTWTDLLGPAFTVYALASLESLLSSSAVDKLARGRRYDPDQELIGQGLGNLASALIGGIPITGVIARSALNVHSGAKTRRAAIAHSLVLVAAVFAFAPWMARIPVAALAGVLVSVAFRMLDPRRLVAMWRVSRPDALVSGATFVAIVGLDLIDGVQWGSAAALVIAAVRLGQTHVRLHSGGDPSAVRLELAGPVTFLSSLKVEHARTRLEKLGENAKLVLDLSGVTFMDSTGAEAVVDLIGTARARGMAVAASSASADVVRQIVAADHAGVVDGTLATTPQQAARMLARRPLLTARQRLLVGVDHYHHHHLPRYKALLERLATRQSPHTLLITCCDSRIQPSLLTSSDPGELFIVRNIGNMVPRYSLAKPPSVGAAIEYGVGVLDVGEVVVCAHSRCGALHALMHPDEVPSELGALRSWLDESEVRDLCGNLPSSFPQDDAARINALIQLDHLRTYPIVRERLHDGSLRLDAWFFDIGTGELEEWDAAAEAWLTLRSEEHLAKPVVRSRIRSSPVTLAVDATASGS